MYFLFIFNSFFFFFANCRHYFQLKKYYLHTMLKVIFLKTIFKNFPDDICIIGSFLFVSAFFWELSQY